MAWGAKNGVVEIDNIDQWGKIIMLVIFPMSNYPNNEKYIL